MILSKDTCQIESALTRIGVKLTELQLENLKEGLPVSLEHLSLGEIGSIFILAAAVSAINLGQSKTRITFSDLPRAIPGCSNCAGLPIYCWLVDEFTKYSLYLTLMEGKLMISTCNQVCQNHQEALT